MSSVLAWMDYAEDDRRRMLEVVALFRMQETRDELGLGSIRDTFSDRLFPGTSTIQSRPRYFFFVPWAMRRLERERVPSSRAVEKARRFETHIIESLRAGEETDGVLGRDAGANLLRLPSVAYWWGLRTYRIRRFPGSINDYFRALDDIHQRSVATPLKAESDELHERAQPSWDPGLPEEPDDLWQATTLSLRPVEAQYLVERVLATSADSLLAHCLQGAFPREMPDAPWDYPVNLPPDLKELVEHARLFSLVFHGAALLYNLELARSCDHLGISGGASHVDHYTEALESWASEVRRHGDAVAAWDRLRFWSFVDEGSARITPAARGFVDSWTRTVQERFETIVTDGTASHAIISREHQVKRRMARYNNRQRLEVWNGASASQAMTFRWPTARRLILDVSEGLGDA